LISLTGSYILECFYVYFNEISTESIFYFYHYYEQVSVAERVLVCSGTIKNTNFTNTLPRPGMSHRRTCTIWPRDTVTSQRPVTATDHVCTVN